MQDAGELEILGKSTNDQSYGLDQVHYIHYQKFAEKEYLIVECKINGKDRAGDKEASRLDVAIKIRTREKKGSTTVRSPVKE